MRFIAVTQGIDIRPDGEKPVDRPGGDREGVEDRQDQRQDAIKDRQEDRQDWADDAREDRQKEYKKVRKERQEHYEKYYDEYWGWHHAHWRAHYYSRAAFLALDCGRTTVVVSTHSYYYCGGTYYDRVYIQNEVQYVPVSAPSGAELDQLDDATVVVVDGESYYLADGSFYTKLRRDGKDVYVVIDPPLGAEVTSLPQETREFQVGNDTYYQFDKVFYMKHGSGYVVVDPPPSAG